MPKKDRQFRFVFDHTPIRGQLVSLDASWNQCLQNSEAGTLANTLLGQALAAVTLLAGTLKTDGKLTLQIRGQGDIHLLVAEATDKHCIRGLVKQSSEAEDSGASLQQLFGSDKMVLTIDQEKSKPYQGIVPLTGHSLNGALEHYFQQSEQLPTRLWLACNESSAVGLLLQKLPGTEEDSDSWNRITQLASTITDEELLGLEQTEILHRLFHEETIRLFEPDSLRFRCSCSREKISTMIHSLGKQEAQDILKQQGEINVHCEFCNARYDFDAIDVEQIFLPGNPLPTTKTTH